MNMTSVSFLIDLYLCDRLLWSKKGPANDFIHCYSNGKEECLLSCTPEEEYVFRKLITNEKQALRFVRTFYKDFNI